MQFNKRQILKDSVIYTVLPKISFVAGIIITPFISKYLTLNDFGIYGLILSLTAIFQTLVVIGQNVVIQNAFFEYRSNYKLIWRRSFGLMIVAAITGAALFCVVAYPFLADKLNQNTTLVFALVSLYIILSPIDAIAVSHYVLHQKSYPYAKATALSGLLNQLIIFITIKFFKLGYLGWIIAMPCGYIFQYVFYSKELFVREKIFPVFKLKKNFYRKAFKIGLPLIPHQLSLYVLGTSDRLLLDVYKVKTDQIGIYNQGYGLGSYAIYLVSGVFQALSRFFHEAFRSNNKTDEIQLRKYIIFTPVAINILLAIVSLWMKEIYKFLFAKPELQTGYPVAIVVMCSYMFWSLYTLFTYPLVIQKKTSMIARISVIAAIFNIVGNIVLIPKYGIWSAVITTYFGYMVFGTAGLLNKSVKASFEKYVNIYKFCFVLVTANILLLAICYAMKDESFVYKIIISALFVVIPFILLKKKLKTGTIPAQEIFK
jgi:O-antigen/teichoic acid export membrane protein